MYIIYQQKQYMSLISKNEQKSGLIVYQKVRTEMEENSLHLSRRIATQQTPLKIEDALFTQSNKKKNTRIPSKQKHKTEFSLGLNSAVEKLIEQEIVKGKLKISQNKLNFHLLSERKMPQKRENTQQRIKQKMLEMQKKKFETIQMLRQLQKEQKEIKRQYVTFRYKEQSNQRNSKRKQRSFFSPEEREYVKKMLKKQNMLQIQLKQKTQIMIGLFQKSAKLERQREAEQRQMEKSLHKSIVEEKRKSSQMRKLQKLKEIQLSNKNYEEVKSKNYLYQKMLESDYISAQQEIKAIHQKLSRIKQKMKVPLVDELKEHKQKYQQLMKMKKLGSKNSHLSTESQIDEIKKFEQNYFMKLVKDEILTKKQEEEAARNKVYQFKEKVKRFSEHLNAEIRPKIKITQQSRFVPIERNRSANSLNHFEQYQKGAEYLSIAKKMKKWQSIQDEKVLTKDFEKTSDSPSKVTYKNYLNDVRRMSQLNPQNYNKKFALYLKNQGTISQFNSLHKAMTMAESLQSKSKRTRNQKLMDTVQNKIELLKMIV